MYKAFTTVLLVLFTALIAAGVVYWLKPSSQVDVTVVIQKMRDISELATTEWTLATFVEQEFKSKLLDLPKGLEILEPKIESDFVIGCYTGTVRGSVDMGKAIVEQQSTDGGRRISIRFPRNSVLISKTNLDNDRSKLISCRERLKQKGIQILKPANEAQRQGMRRRAEAEIRAVAIQYGIVNTTQNNAEKVLTNFVSPFGYQVTVKFDKDAYDPAAPDTLVIATR